MRRPSQFSLFSQRRFAPFFWTQFCGALNDNVFKTALLTALTFDALNWTSIDRGMLNNLIPGLFILPFVLFSALAGQLADKFEKSRFIRLIKLLEIAIMLVAACGWWMRDLWLLIAAVVGMGLHSTLFGPVKYAYLPQTLARDELIGGNGVVEMGTFVGILLGEVLGAVLVSHQPWGIGLVAGGTLAIALIGWLCSRAIPHLPAPAPDLTVRWNIVTESLRNIRFSSRNRPVFVSMLANSWFWFYGAIVLAQFPLYAKETLHGDHSVFVLLLTLFSLGIGVGSLLCERLSGHQIEIGLVPFGAIGLTVFGFDLYAASVAYAGVHAVDALGFLQQAGGMRILLDCLLIGAFGGFYIVPLFAVIQTRCDRLHVSRTIAGVNILNALFMVGAALAGMLLLKAGFSIPQLFMITALLNALVALCLFLAMPEFWQRFCLWVTRRGTSTGVE
jgi:MFS family permease